MLLSESHRKFVNAVLCCLNCTALVSLNIALFLVFSVHSESRRLGDFLIIYSSRSLVVSIAIVAVMAFILHLFGSKLFYECIFTDSRTPLLSMLFYWLLVCCVTICVSIVLLIILTAYHATFHKHIALGLMASMNNYKVSPKSRSFINRIQIEHGCCGVNSPSDWYSISWVDSKLAAPVSHLAKSPYMQPDGEFTPRWLPFSCCKKQLTGAPCESVRMFFEPRKNISWASDHGVLSLDFLSQYDLYVEWFATLQDLLLSSSTEKQQETGMKVVKARGHNFLEFLEVSSAEVAVGDTASTSSNMTISNNFNASHVRERRQVDVLPSEQAASMRRLLEASGVHADGIPDQALVHFVDRKPELPGPPSQWWNASMIDTFEVDNLNQLLRYDMKVESEVLEKLRSRSFYQRGCKKSVAAKAGSTLMKFTLIFVYVTITQVMSLILGRLSHSSMTSAVKLGDVSARAPCYWFKAPLPYNKQTDVKNSAKDSDTPIAKIEDDAPKNNDDVAPKKSG